MTHGRLKVVLFKFHAANTIISIDLAVKVFCIFHLNSLHVLAQMIFSYTFRSFYIQAGVCHF